MRKLLALLAVSTQLCGYTAHLINGTDTYLNFYIKTSLLGCGCNGLHCSPEVQWFVAPGTTEEFRFTGACKGACFTSIEVKESNCTIKEGPVKGFTETDRLGNWTLEGKQGLHFGDQVSLKSHGIYLGVNADDKNGGITFDRTKAGEWERWFVYKPGDEKATGPIKSSDTVALKNFYTKKYLSADENRRDVAANRDAVGAWETWRIGISGTTVTLLSPQGGKKPYLSYWGTYPDCSGDKQTFGTADFGAGACEDVDVMVYKQLREIPKLGFTNSLDGWNILSAQGKSNAIRYGDHVVLTHGNRCLGVNNNQTVFAEGKVTPETTWIVLSPRNPNDTGVIKSYDNVFLKSAVGGYLQIADDLKQARVANVSPGTAESWLLKTDGAVGVNLNYATTVGLWTLKPTPNPYFSGWVDHEPYIIVDKRGGGDVGHIIKRGFEDFGHAIKIEQIRKTPEILKKSFEIAGLGVKLGALIAAKESSSGFMEGMRQGSGGLLRSLPEIVKTLQVRKIEFEGSAHDMYKGVFPHGSLEVVLMGKTYEVNDVKFDPLGAYHSLKQVIIDGAEAIKQEWDNFINLSNKIGRELSKISR